jgi:carbon-monoxide dehydrogenase large subunit
VTSFSGIREEKKSIGQRISRLEDERFLTGAGRFVADFVRPGMLHAVVLRSQLARGTLRRVGTDVAERSPGVVAVLTGADAARDELGGIPWEVCPPGFETMAAFPDDPRVALPQPILALHEVRYVGEPIALVIAETLAAALQGAERIEVDIDELPPVMGLPRDALDRWDAPEGTAFSSTVGDRAQAQAIFETAPHVVALKTHVPRLAAAPMETRGYLAWFEAPGEWTVVASAGKPHPVRDTIARHVLHVPPESIRVIAPDIGGGFGAKNVAHAEMALVLWAARRLLRPVRWISTRNESFLSDMQGRGHMIAARLALDDEGRFLAVQYRSLVDLGAYVGPRAVVPCVSGLKVLTGPYRIETVFGRMDALHSNSVPTCPYRGAGVPETAFVIERLVDQAARRLRLDPAEIRARNLLAPSDLPWNAPTGSQLHSADFPGVLTAARTRARWDRRGERRAVNGRQRGTGMAFTIEAYGTSYDEAAEIIAHGDGCVEVLIGTKSSGQSHETTYAQIAGDALDLEVTALTIVQGDTALIARGNGTGASRSITTGGAAITCAAALFLVEARKIAGRLLQCEPDMLAYAGGCFSAAGAQVDLAAIARCRPGSRLHVTGSFRPELASFPHGCHIAEVDVDPETGEVELVSYCAVQDAGIAIHPTVVESQLRGGIAQGIGAALMEQVRYDAWGQAVTASFLDYALPRAADMSRIDVALRGIPCISNPLGAKAVGEAGTVAAPPAIINAIVDALSTLGIEHLDMPATPDRIWAALRSAKSSRSKDM